MSSDNKENSSSAQAKETIANKGKTTIEKSQHIDYQNKHVESDKKHVTKNHDDNVSQTSSSTTTNGQTNNNSEANTSKPKQWSDLFTKLRGGKATFVKSSPRFRIHSKNENALIFNIQSLSNIATNDI